MKRFTFIILLISLILLNVYAFEENKVNTHINSGDSDFNGYEISFTEESIDNGKAIVDTLNDTPNDDLINNSENIENTNKGVNSSVILMPMLAVFCICAVASIGLLIKNKVSKKTKPRRKSLHFEDDDELSKILVPSSPASAINNKELLTIRNAGKESNVTNDNDNRISNKQVSFLPINHAYKSTLPWSPKHLDEIKLNVGDIVCVKKCYSDGYSYGRNVTTRVEGIFPTCCLSSMEETIDQAAIENWVNYGMFKAKKRTTSLFLNDIAYRM